MTVEHYVDYYVLANSSEEAADKVANSDYEDESTPYNEEVLDIEDMGIEVVGD